MPLTGHVSHVNVIMAQLTIESLWLSGRAAELGIWQSKVWFLMGTHKFSSHEVHAKTNKCLTVLSYFCKGWQDLEITLIVCKPKALLPVDCGCKGKEISLNFFLSLIWQTQGTLRDFTRTVFKYRSHSPIVNTFHSEFLNRIFFSSLEIT